MRSPFLACMLVAGTAIAVLAGLILLPRSTRSPERRVTLHPPPRPAPPPPLRKGSAPEDPGILALRAADPRSAAALREAGTLLRARCRSNKDLVRGLAALLLDPSQPPHAREVAAFVLGSLSDLEARRALLTALERGGDGDWVRNIVLALGSALDDGRDDAFSIAEGPYIQSTPSGLHVEIRRVITDPEIRDALERRLGRPETEVRRAVIRALQHTLVSEARSRSGGEEVDLGTVRSSFLSAMARDADESVRAEAARALGEWAVTAPPQSRGHAEVVEQILRKCFEPEEDQIRFRAQQALKQTPLPADAVALAFETAARSADFEARAWALELCGAQARALGQERLGELVALSLKDADAKVRDVGVQQITALEGSPVVRALAMQALHDAAWHVRCAAIRAVEALPADPAFVPELERMSREDPHEDVRAAAARALPVLRRK